MFVTIKSNENHEVFTVKVSVKGITEKAVSDVGKRQREENTESKPER